MLTRRGWVFGAVLLGVFSGASASEQVSGNPAYSAAADSSGDQSDFSVKIQTNVGNGSGALFAESMGMINGVNTIALGIATADHVMNGATRWSVGIADGLSMITLGNQNLTENYTPRGPGNYTDPEDLGYIGIRIGQNQVGANTWNFLQSLSDVNGLLGTASSTPGIVIHNYGYGLSGQYLQGNMTTAVTNPVNPIGYRWSNTMPIQDQYGVGRVTNQISVGIQPIDSFEIDSSEAAYPYEYDGITWALPTNNPQKLGQINSGDSGGAIQSFTGAIVGVNTLAFGSNVMTNAAGRTIQEDFLYGTTFSDGFGDAQDYSGAGVAFNQGDVNFLNNQFMITSAPEPASLAALTLLGVGMLARRRRIR